MKEPLSVLSWDSEFFGVTIARLWADRIGPGDVERALAWCAEHGVACLYFLATPEDPESIARAEAAGFGLKDVRLVLDRTLPMSAPATEPGEGGGRVRPFQEGDLPGLERIAATSHTATRFFFDGRFPRHRAEELYRTWIRRSCQGPLADQVLVLDTGSPAGYVTCRAPSSGSGEIGLFALAEEARGRSLGPVLLEAALRWFDTRGIARVEVATQARNVAAQRLYQRGGFRTRSIGYWYHRWSS